MPQLVHVVRGFTVMVQDVVQHPLARVLGELAVTDLAMTAAMTVHIYLNVPRLL